MLEMSCQMYDGFITVPDSLYHYYEYSTGSFINISDLSLEEAEKIQRRICEEGRIFASKRNSEYHVN